MSLITKMLRQKAVYWEPDVPDKFGQPTLGVPVEIKCRWEDKAEEFLDANGSVQVSRAVVYVGSDLKLGGRIWLGELVDVPSSTENNPDVYEIRKVEKTPNMKATEFLRSVML